MVSIAEFRLPADAFPLGTVFVGLPNATVYLDRVVPGTGRVVPYFWVRDTDRPRVRDQFGDHPGVRDVREVDRVDGDHLLRCEWVPDHAGILDVLTADAVTLLSAVGTADGWTFEIRGDTREAIARFQAHCRDRSIPIELTELHTLQAIDANDVLTDAQQEALALAYDRGYFDSPRQATLAELADGLDITQQALGARLQRATRRLVERALGAQHR